MHECVFTLGVLLLFPVSITLKKLVSLLILPLNFWSIFFRAAASAYLKRAGETHGTVQIIVSVGKASDLMQM